MKFRPGGISADSVLRRFLPRSLLGRSLLIVLVPLIALQAVALQIFYGSHLNELSRRLADGVAGDVAFDVDAVSGAPAAAPVILAESYKVFLISGTFSQGQVLRHLPPADAPGPVDDDLANALKADLQRPFAVAWYAAPAFIRINVQMDDGVLTLNVPRKRLYIGTVYIFVGWLIGTATLVFAIAALFLRTQVRGIKRLAAAAENFGMGRDSGGPIRPEGATEIRRAAAAFNRMQERIRRFVVQRTTMLAGVSHDLRTPLTRLRLALAMLPVEVPATDLADMEGDIDEMERLIAIYINFARGEGAEQAVLTDVSALLDEVAAAARRAGAAVVQDYPETLAATVRPEAVRRALTNLLDNARRHGQRTWLTASLAGRNSLRILVDDDGPGIPAPLRETMFRAFEAADPRGTGLGLAIARDIVGAHGGDIAMADRPGGGLRVIVTLPA